MGQHSDRAREALLNAAEELFAKEGLDAVSSRRIAEHAGNANHSAVKYHFGGRDGLLEVLLARGREAMQDRRAELIAALPADPTARDLLATGIIPWTEYLASLPVPSWRARFSFLAASTPSLRDSMRQNITQSDYFQRDLPRDASDLRGISPRILQARAGILGQLTLGLCAERERQVEQGTDEGSWESFSYFVIDAAAGLFAAPVTPRSEYVHRRSA